jgi:SNF2 family DNA or RNA helicase
LKRNTFKPICVTRFLKQVRRLKSDVLDQLPPKRRQVIRLRLEVGDIKQAKEQTAGLTAELLASGKGYKGHNKLARMEALMMEEEGGEEEEALRRLVERGGEQDLIYPPYCFNDCVPDSRRSRGSTCGPIVEGNHSRP